MSVYHTPRCRITWTNVRSNGLDRDVVVTNRPLILSFGLEFDPAIRRQASQFAIRFDLFPRGDAVVGGYWYGPMNQLPGGTSGSIWVSMTWTTAGRALDWHGTGAVLYRPSVHFNIGGGAIDEFAVAEEDHYIFVEYRFRDKD